MSRMTIYESVKGCTEKPSGQSRRRVFMRLCLYLAMLFISSSCAKMGEPDGGWYDETPPKILGSTPKDGSVNVKAKKVDIFFDEYIKLDNDNEKVVVSPPQMEMPVIRGQGKHITVELKDSLKPNTTYTIDFSDAISDNNEGNPLGNYTYSFSTGETIDNMQVSGYVLEADNLEPIKGILVGLYENLNDTAFRKEPMLRVSRTDSRGHFVIKGIRPAEYRVYALQDADGNYFFSQKSEKIAFSKDIITPSFSYDVRQDTIWRDSLRIDSISRVRYTRFKPDNIVLRAFTELQTDRYLVKSERKYANRMTFYFSYGNEHLPEIKGLDFDGSNAFITECSENKDTVTYWLLDTALINRDTLNVEIRYFANDSSGVLRMHNDTLQMLSKEPYSRRMRERQSEIERWEKQQRRLKERGEKYDAIMPPKPLEVKYIIPQRLEPDRNVTISLPTPLKSVDTTAIHLYSKHDTLWYRAKFRLEKMSEREYRLRAEWRPGIEYSIEADTMAFVDIYGMKSSPFKQGLIVGAEEDYGTLIVQMNNMRDRNAVVQLLDGQDKPVKEVMARNGTAEIFYINPGKYYMRMYVDENNNRKWDTGDYDKGIQAEHVYYYNKAIEIKAKRDITANWNPEAMELNRQKPGEITRQKAEKEKKIRKQNAQRAAKLGLQYVPNM